MEIAVLCAQLKGTPVALKSLVTAVFGYFKHHPVVTHSFPFMTRDSTQIASLNALWTETKTVCVHHEYCQKKKKSVKRLPLKF